MMQNDATITVKQHKTSKTSSNDNNVHFKVKVNICLMSNISKMETIYGHPLGELTAL